MRNEAAGRRGRARRGDRDGGRGGRPAPGLAPQGRRAGRVGPRAAARRALERARAAGQDVAADQYPYTAAATTLATVLPPEILALEPDEAVAALRDPSRRARIRALQAQGVSGWENVARDPGWDGIVISRTASRPEWNGRSLADIAGSEGGDPADLALDVLADDRLSVDIVIHCMDDADLVEILRVPWIGGLHRRGRPPARASGSSTPGCRIRGRTARRRGCSATSCASAACSRSRPPSRSSAPSRRSVSGSAIAARCARAGWRTSSCSTRPRSPIARLRAPCGPPRRDPARRRQRPPRGPRRGRDRRPRRATPAGSRLIVMPCCGDRRGRDGDRAGRAAARAATSPTRSAARRGPGACASSSIPTVASSSRCRRHRAAAGRGRTASSSTSSPSARAGSDATSTARRRPAAGSSTGPRSTTAG